MKYLFIVITKHSIQENLCAMAAENGYLKYYNGNEKLIIHRMKIHALMQPKNGHLEVLKCGLTII